MISTIFSFSLVLIFSILSLIHVYWFLGGTRGLMYAIPTRTDRMISLDIPRSATIIVAVVLAIFALVYVEMVISYSFFSDSIAAFARWGIPIIFLLRAIGEFNYVGFFKKVKGTPFANADTILFSPLCLYIGSIGMYFNFETFI